MMHKQPETDNLLSNHTIPILSFFIIGVVVGRMIEAEMYAPGILTAVFGIASFIGLEYSSRKRREKKEKTEEHLFASQLQSRIDKILLHESSVAEPKMSLINSRNSVQQYVTVAQSSGKQIRPQRGSTSKSGTPHFMRYH